MEISVPTDRHYIPLVVLGSITSFLSILGSGCLLYMTSKKLDKMYHRIVLSLSIAGMISSWTRIIMPYLIPSFLGLAGASGNFASCSAAGFLLSTSGMIGGCYNCWLSLYFFLTVRCNWKEHDFTRRAEVSGHVLVFVVSMSTSLVAVATQSYNPSPIGTVCTLYRWPWGCDDIDRDCQRSNPVIIGGLIITRTVLAFIISFVSFTFTYLVWRHVRKTLKQSTAYRFEGDKDAATEERLKDVSTQAILYSLVYFNTFIWPFIGLILAIPGVTTLEFQERTSNSFIYILQIMYWALAPLQGFFNFCVYTRMNVKAWKKVEPERSLLSIYIQTVFTNSSPRKAAVAPAPQQKGLNQTVVFPDPTTVHYVKFSYSVDKNNQLIAVEIMDPNMRS